MQQAARLMDLYVADHDDVYPLAHESLYEASKDWDDALVAGGYVESGEALDPPGFKAKGVPTISLSMCLVYDPAFMRPETAIRISQATTSPVRAHQVAFPSDKGVLWNWWIYFGKFNTHWCCDPFRPIGPVAMADGSVHALRWTDMKSDPPPDFAKHMGVPVQSTWGGYLGRDR